MKILLYGYPSRTGKEPISIYGGVNLRFPASKRLSPYKPQSKNENGIPSQFFDLPVGNDFELGIAAAGSDLYRNSTGAAYPYTIGTLASITGHNSPNSATYHYFFYNLQFVLID